MKGSVLRDIQQNETAVSQGINDLFDDEQPIDIKVYWRIVRSRIWIILGLAALSALLATLIVHTIQPVYQSTATIMIGTEPNKVLMMGDVYETAAVNDTYFQTQYEVLKSRDLAQKVIDKLKLGVHPEFVVKPMPKDEKTTETEPDQEVSLWQTIKQGLPSLFDNPKQNTSRVDGNFVKYSEKEGLISNFLQRLTVTPRQFTQLIDISFEATDPELASLVVDTLGETYIESTLSGHLTETRNAADWLFERLQALKEKLTVSERKLQAYLQKENLIDLEGVMTLTKGEIEGNAQRLAEAHNARMQAEALYNKVKNLGDSLYSNIEVVPEVFADPVVAQLKQKEAEANQKLSELSKRYVGEHPAMRNARSELDSVQAQLKKYITGSISGIKSRYELALANEQSVARSVNANKAQVQNIGNKQAQLSELQREVASNRTLYETFFNRYKEASEAVSLKEASVRFVDRANHPLVPIKPNKTRIVLLAFVAALIGGVMLAFLLEYLDSTLKSPEDVEYKLGVALLGLIPFYKLKKTNEGDIANIASVHPKSAFAESVRTVRTGLVLSALDSPHNTWLITSSLAGEGKSTLATNLAVSMGQMNIGRVLLIDADLRRPTLTKPFEQLPKGCYGLAHALSRIADLKDCLHTVGRAIASSLS